MFLVRSVCLFVCLSVCQSNNWKSCERILTKFLGGVGHGPGTNEFNFGDVPVTVRIQESEVRNLHSLDYRKSYQRILMKFYGELGCGLETNCLHFGDDSHHYPDPGVRSGSRSGSRKNCHNSIMLAFGGGLSCLSTSSFVMRSSDGTVKTQWISERTQFSSNITYNQLSYRA